MNCGYERRPRALGRALLGVVALVLLALLLPANPARAIVSYTDPKPLSASSSCEDHWNSDIAMNDSGRATAVWTCWEEYGLPDTRRIQSTSLAADGTQGPIRTLSGYEAFWPVVGIADSGRATVAWVREQRSGGELTEMLEAVRIEADGTVGPVKTLAVADSTVIAPFDVEIDSAGRATVLWSQWDGSNYRLQVVRLGAALGNPGPVKTLSEAGADAGGGQLVIDSSDRVTVVWSRAGRAQSARLGASAGNPGPTKTLSEAGQNAYSPHVAVDGSGRATVVWSRSDGSDLRAQAVRISADGTVGQIKTLSPAGQDAWASDVAIDDSDRATVVWSRSDGSHQRIQSARLGASAGNPGPVKTLSMPGEDAFGPQVVVGRSGGATVAWEVGEFLDYYRVEVVRIASNGTPGPVKIPSGGGADSYAAGVSLAADDSGRAAITWEENFEYGGTVELVRAEVSYPQTTISSGPAGPTNDDSPSFGFTTTAPGSSFECRLDGGAWSACSSPTAYSKLADGPHTFAVRAIDAETDADPTPATRGFTVDTAAPQTSITSGPAGTTDETSPSFGFSANEGGASFECRLDGGAWSACSSPTAYSKLADGPHSFEVRATDLASNTDPTPARRDFTVDTTAPQTTITSGPSGLTNDASPAFGFSADEPGSSFECRLDSQSWAPCSSPQSYSDLADGPHRFEVQASLAANTDPTPATRTFTVDTFVNGFASADGVQKQKGKKVVVKAKVTAGENLDARAKGKIKLGGRSYKLKPKTKSISAGKNKNLKLKPKKRKDAKKIAKALKQGKKAQAKLTVEPSDEAGNKTTEKLSVKLKR